MGRRRRRLRFKHLQYARITRLLRECEVQEAALRYHRIGQEAGGVVSLSSISVCYGTEISVLHRLTGIGRAIRTRLSSKEKCKMEDK